MEHAVEVLEKAESVLMQRIRKMKEGNPKWSASEKLRELREAISLIKKRQYLYRMIRLKDLLNEGV